MTMVILGSLTSSYSLLSGEHWEEIVQSILRRELESRYTEKKLPLPQAVEELPSCKFSPELKVDTSGIFVSFLSTLRFEDDETMREVYLGLGRSIQALRDRTNPGWDEVLSSLARLVSAFGSKMPEKYRQDILNWIRKRQDLPKHLQQALA